jgi:hypothetical protein
VSTSGYDINHDKYKIAKLENCLRDLGIMMENDNFLQAQLMSEPGFSWNSGDTVKTHSYLTQDFFVATAYHMQPLLGIAPDGTIKGFWKEVPFYPFTITGKLGGRTGNIQVWIDKTPSYIALREMREYKISLGASYVPEDIIINWIMSGKGLPGFFNAFD